MQTISLLVIVLLGLSGSAYAQNCGVMPSVNGVCIPPDSPTSPLHSTYGQHSPQPAAPHEIWVDRWAVIAIDSTSSSVGASTAMPSKRKAEKAAMAQCRSKGGGAGCKIALTYLNQCGVIAWGTNHWVTYNGPTIEEASAPAIEECSKHTDDCLVYYADCSYPERIQ